MGAVFRFAAGGASYVCLAGIVSVFRLLVCSVPWPFAGTYESGYRHCRRAGSDGAHFWQYSAVFVRRHNHGGGVLCYIRFSLSVQSAAKRFLFIPAGDSAHFLLCQVGDGGTGTFAGLLRRRDRMLVGAAADSSQVACSTGCRLRPSTVFVCYAPLRQARYGNTGPCLSVSAAVCPWD